MRLMQFRVCCEGRFELALRIPDEAIPGQGRPCEKERRSFLKKRTERLSLLRPSNFPARFRIFMLA
jgi:hypothetical protein